PQNPYTTLGTAASISTRNDPARRNQCGAISERNAAVPMPSGTAISMANADDTSVPYTKAIEPNTRWDSSGFQSVDVKKASAVAVIDSQAWRTKTMSNKIATRITTSAAA